MQKHDLRASQENRPVAPSKRRQEKAVGRTYDVHPTYPLIITRVSRYHLANRSTMNNELSAVLNNGR
jgi:hypothetical protein